LGELALSGSPTVLKLWDVFKHSDEGKVINKKFQLVVLLAILGIVLLLAACTQAATVKRI
jgi:hypothetical protein